MRSAIGGRRAERSSPLAMIARLVLAAAAVTVGVGAFAPSSAQATTHSQIVADGSSWAANAVNTWVASVVPQGLQVVFTSTGSAQGRSDFAQNTVDFAVSDIGYQGKDPLTGAADNSSRQYAYLPIASGGTSFPYHLIVNGKMWTSLRLSGQTLARIFTNQITNWNDPAITADNNGVALPSLPIVPIVHSEGSGSTYQFTAYLAQQYPSIWQNFAGADVPTEYWPSGKGQQISREWLRWRGQLPHVQLGKRIDRLRRVLVPAGRRLPGCEDLECCRVLHTPDAVQRRSGPHTGSDRPDDFAAETDQRLYVQRSTDLPVVVVFICRHSHVVD